MSIFNTTFLIIIILLSAIAIGMIISIITPNNNKKKMSDSDVKELNTTLAGVLILSLLLITLLYTLSMTGEAII